MATTHTVNGLSWEEWRDKATASSSSDLDTFLRCVDQALACFPPSGEHYKLLVGKARMYINHKKYDNAVEVANAAILMTPAKTSAYVLFCWCCCVVWCCGVVVCCYLLPVVVCRALNNTHPQLVSPAQTIHITLAHATLTYLRIHPTYHSLITYFLQICCKE